VLTTLDLLLDAVRFIRLLLRARSALTAENLFLRKQLALYLERQGIQEPRGARSSGALSRSSKRFQTIGHDVTCFEIETRFMGRVSTSESRGWESPK